MRRAPIAAVVLAIFSTPARRVSAEPAPATTPAGAPVVPPPVTPPTAEGNTDVPYPEGASGDATVELELDVDKDGRVVRAAVVSGEAPFAEHARRAVLTWRFAPARRGNAPVAARIKARVAFQQEEPASAATAPGSSQGATPTPPVKPPEPRANAAPIVVEVRGVRHEIGETTLGSAEVREMPGTFGDPFRAIEALPGVMPIVSGLPYFYIRGAPPNNNAYLLDGIRVPLLFHVGIGEAVIHPALIEHVDFYPGSAPAAYGRAAGAVIAGQTREPPAIAHGEVNLRLIDAGALLESPLADGRASVLVAGRYGYPGPILSAITSSVKLGYWDYQARATWRFADRDTLGIFAFGSHDYLGTAPTRNGQVGPVTEQLGSDFHRLDLRYDRALEDGRLRFAITLGYDSMGGAGESDSPAPAVTTVTNRSAAARLEFEQGFSSALRLRAGMDAQLDHYRLTQGQAPLDENGLPFPQVPSTADPPPTNVTSGAHADVVWRVTERVEIVPGVRVDLFESRRSSTPSAAGASTFVPAVDPRLSTRVTLTPWLKWLSSVGLTHQYPVLRVGAIPALLVSVPGFPTGDSQLQTALQVSQGAEFMLPWDFTLTTTGFLSGWSGLTDLTSNCLQIQPPVQQAQPGNMGPPPVPWTCPSNDPARGIAYGLEVLLRRPLTKRLTGWLAYTLSRSVRREHFITLSGGDALAKVVSDNDRTHVLNAILAYDLGRRWRAGGRFLFLSGTPYSTLAGNVPAPPYNNRRTPPFYRVDVRVEKRWPFAKDGFIAFIAEVQNVTLSKEVTPYGTDCTGNQTAQGGDYTTECRPSSVGPLTLPSLGVEASF